MLRDRTWDRSIGCRDLRKKLRVQCPQFSVDRYARTVLVVHQDLALPRPPLISAIIYLPEGAVMSKIKTILVFAAGYVIGARAGRGRYEEIKKQAVDLWDKAAGRPTGGTHGG